MAEWWSTSRQSVSTACALHHCTSLLPNISEEVHERRASEGIQGVMERVRL